MYLTYNNKDEEYNKNKIIYFPPNIEREIGYNINNNKYNLANPLI